MIVLDKDWYGYPAGFPVEFRLEVVEERLEFTFVSGRPAECDQVAGFVAGLWKKDVGEFFLMFRDGSYLEFNVSPTGAWWSARFRSYRDQECECQFASVVTRASYSAEGWRAFLSVALAEVGLWERVNLCAVLGGRYFCYGHSGGGEPDFHLAENFVVKSGAAPGIGAIGEEKEAGRRLES